MTDSDIIKALERCRTGDCWACPLTPDDDCRYSLHKGALDFVKRQQAEIERLTINMNAFGLGMKTEAERANRLETEKDALICNYKECAMEAVRDFAERLKAKAHKSCEWWPILHAVDAKDIDETMAEMEETP